VPPRGPVPGQGGHPPPPPPGPPHRRLRAAPGRRGAMAEPMKTPLSVYLPFNRDALRGTFEPAKGGTEPAAREGHWLLVQDQGLLVSREGDGFHLPQGRPPAGLAGALGEPLWLGTWQG